MSTPVGSIYVSGLKTQSQYVDHFVVECYLDAGLTTLVGTQTSGAVWDGSQYSNQTDLILFSGLNQGQTYYLRAAAVTPVSGAKQWSTTFGQIAGNSAPAGITYSGTYTSTTSGVSFIVYPQNPSSNIDSYEAIWTWDGSTPLDSSKPLAVCPISGANNFTFFAGGVPGYTATVFVRAVDSDGLKQTWTLIGTFTIASQSTGPIVGNFADGTVLGTNGVTIYGGGGNIGFSMSPAYNNRVSVSGQHYVGGSVAPYHWSQWTGSSGGYYGTGTYLSSYYTFDNLSNANRLQLLSNGSYGVGGTPLVQLHSFGAVRAQGAGTGSHESVDTNSGGATAKFVSGYSYPGYAFTVVGTNTPLVAATWGLAVGSLPTSDPFSLGGISAMSFSPHNHVRLSSSRSISLTNSQYSQTSTTSPLTAAYGASITIAAHSVQYPWGQVNYNGGTISGLANGTLYYVYCSDPGYEGGAVTWLASTNKLNTMTGDDVYAVGTITTPSSSGGTSTGGGGSYCTVEGTRLQTDRGLLSNCDVYNMWKGGHPIRFRGLHGYEEIKYLEWVPVERFYEVSIDGFTSFRCSTSHMILPYGSSMPKPLHLVDEGRMVWTQDGWRTLMRRRLVEQPARVLKVSLDGPSHQYWVEEGVWTHNMKIYTS